MEVILIQDVDNLGAKNEVVKVKDGYARNFLIPKKFAINCTSSNLKQLEGQLKVKAKKEAALLAEINKVIEILTASPVKVIAKIGISGKIFGSITTLQIARAIRDQKGYEIDRKKIQIVEDAKELGIYKATIDFGNQHSTTISFEVVAEA